MKRKLKKIDHQTVTRAMHDFESNGGVIHYLPAQKYCMRHVIGDERYNHYEPLHAFSSLA